MPPAAVSQCDSVAPTCPPGGLRPGVTALNTGAGPRGKERLFSLCASMSWAPGGGGARGDGQLYARRVDIARDTERVALAGKVRSGGR